MESKPIEIDIELMRHSFAHVLAMATLRLYPGTRLGIGPATKNGFYYEFDLPTRLKEADLIKIEDEMRKIIAEEIPFKQIMVEREQAFNTLVQLGQIYKTELLQSIPDTQISFYKTGEEFIDMCRGPHIDHTGQLGAFKLTGLSDVHWFGENTRPILQRVDGLGFASTEEMAEYEKHIEGIKLRDHRKLGKSLSLFDNNIWLSKGVLLKTLIKERIHSELKTHNYNQIETPTIVENVTRKTCLTGAIEAFKNKRRSYKELPFKLFETGLLEGSKSEIQYGLYDINPCNSTEAFSFLGSHDLVAELQNSINMNMDLYKLLELSLSAVELCVPDLSGIEFTDKEKTTLNNHYQLLKSTMIESEIDFDIVTKSKMLNNSPFINFVIKDISDRPWDIGAISILFDNKRLSPTVTNSRNNPERTTIIYNSVIDSYERIIATLVESLDGNLPLWFSPVQVDILSISEKYNQYVDQLGLELSKEGIRNICNTLDSTIQTKIRKSQLQKTPYMLIIGEKEIKTNSVSLRNRNGQELGLIRIDEFINKLHSEINIEKKPSV